MVSKNYRQNTVQCASPVCRKYWTILNNQLYTHVMQNKQRGKQMTIFEQEVELLRYQMDENRWIVKKMSWMSPKTIAMMQQQEFEKGEREILESVAAARAAAVAVKKSKSNTYSR